MSDENRMSEAEAKSEEQPVAETPKGEDAPVLEESPDESVAQAVADTDGDSEAEAVAEPEVETVAEPEAEAATETAAAAEPAAVASAGPDADTGRGEQETPTFNRVEGPAIFNRARQGNQRRNPRHVGNDVRIDEIDYKNIQVLSRFVDNYGRIHNRRKTRVTAKMQRKVTRAIKRARHLALMPYTGEHIRITGRRG
ncbi:MAG: 30S ribosomal protein S18 [Caldilineaceae bacterium]|nr:30S ribosomal protein S18 [Caldilineaceae bacterium]MCY3989644.1 30S ribosomal protein S18 [Caldilineaceae bacterium]